VFAEAIAALPGYRHLACEFASCRAAADHAAAARRLLEGCGAPARVVGWSLGALVALEVAAAAPALVRRLHLVAPTRRFVADGPGEPGVAPEALDALGARLRRDREGALRAFRRQMLSAAERRGGLDAVLGAPAAAPPAPLEALLAGLEYFASFEIDPAAIAVPVDVLVGAADRIVPARAARVLVGGLAQASLVELPQVGHAPPISAPEAFRAWLGEVLAR